MGQKEMGTVWEQTAERKAAQAAQHVIDDVDPIRAIAQLQNWCAFAVRSGEPVAADHATRCFLSAVAKYSLNH